MTIQIELVPESSSDAVASRIPGAISAAAIVPGAVATIFAADDGEVSVYNHLAMRASDPRQTYAGVPAPAPEVHFSGSLDLGGAACDGE
ncbi:hypothetical protein [Arthrobacter sp. HLT1-21]